MKESLDLRKKENVYSKEEEVLKREKDLRELGFSEEFIKEVKEYSNTLFTNMKEKIQNLKTLGFENPNKLIKALPLILGFTRDLIKEKIENLKNLGFENPNKLIEIQPRILTRNQDSIKEKIENLKNLGFESPNKLIEKFPSFFGHSQNMIKDKIENLKNLGFESPNKLIEIFPTVLGLNQDSIKEKIENLRNLGFENPNRLIDKLPAILGLNQDFVKNKVGFYDKVSKLYKLPMTGNEILENVAPAWGTKRGKILIVLNIYKSIIKNLNDLTYRNIYEILVHNLEDTIIAYGDLLKFKKVLSLSGIRIAIKEIKAQNFTKGEKQKKILALKDTLPKIVERYFKAYPIKEEK